MPFLITNWRWLAIAGAIIAVFLGGTHFQRLIDSRKADALVQAQQEANAKAHAEQDAKARKAEAELAAARAQAVNLQTLWEVERHAKSHTVCRLSDSTIGLLQAASQ